MSRHQHILLGWENIIQAALSPGSPAAWNKHGMPQLDQLYGTSSLAVGTERAARRGNVQVLEGVPSGTPSTLLLCFFLVTLSCPSSCRCKLRLHRLRCTKSIRRQILELRSPSSLLPCLLRRPGSGASKVPPVEVTVAGSWIFISPDSNFLKCAKYSARTKTKIP